MMEELLSRPATKRVAIACVAALLFAGVVAVGTHSSGGVGDARLRTKGRATITSAAGEKRTVTGTVALHNGDVVEAVDDDITIDLPNGSTVEGRPGRNQNDATRVKIALPVELLAGELLVVARGGADVDSGGNRFHLEPGSGSDNAARLSRALAVGAGVYRGQGTLDSAGQRRTLRALRSIEVSALGRPPTTLDPLHVSDDDPWDRRFLADAMDLGHTLDNYAASYTSTLGPNARTPRFYRDVLPSLADEDSLTTDLLSARPHTPGDTIVGGAIAGLSRQGGFTDRFRAVFDFHDSGANWGLVALDQGVTRDPLLSEVQKALNLSQLPFQVAARTPPTAATATSTTTTDGNEPRNAPTTTTSPNQPPPTTTTVVPPTGQPLVDGLVNTVNNLLGGLIGPKNTGGGGLPGG